MKVSCTWPSTRPKRLGHVRRDRLLRRAPCCSAAPGPPASRGPRLVAASAAAPAASRERPPGAQRLAQRRHDHLVDEPWLTEAHPGLGGMDVDVHVGRREGDAEHDQREAVARAAAADRRRARPGASAGSRTGRPLMTTRMSSRLPRREVGRARPDRRRCTPCSVRSTTSKRSARRPSPRGRRCAGADRRPRGAVRAARPLLRHAELDVGMGQRELRRRCAGSPPPRWSALLRNLSRAGVLKNRSCTSTVVPGLGRDRELLAHDAALAGQPQPLRPRRARGW